MDANVWQRLSGDLITFTHHAPQLLALSFMSAGPACFFFTIISFTADRATEGVKLGGRTRPKLCRCCTWRCRVLSTLLSMCPAVPCAQCKYYTFLLTVEERSMDPQQCVCVPWGLQTNLNNFLDDLLAVAVVLSLLSVSVYHTFQFSLVLGFSFISSPAHNSLTTLMSSTWRKCPVSPADPTITQGDFYIRAIVNSAVELLFFTGWCFIKFIKSFEWILMKLRGVRLLGFYKFTIYW